MRFTRTNTYLLVLHIIRLTSCIDFDFKKMDKRLASKELCLNDNLYICSPYLLSK